MKKSVLRMNTRRRNAIISSQNIEFYSICEKNIKNICTYEKKAVTLHGFSMVGHIVPGREAVLLTINS